MKKVILESPYAGDVEKNIEYAKLCVLDSLKRGEAPIASHLLYTQKGILDDLKPDERMLGISAGLAWLNACDAQVFYIDNGISKGMQSAMDYADEKGFKYELRRIL